MPRPAPVPFTFVLSFIVACGPEPVTGRPQPNPPGSPAVSSPGPRDSGTDALPDGGSRGEAGREAGQDLAPGGDAHPDAAADIDGGADPDARSTPDAGADVPGDTPITPAARAPAIGDLVIDEIFANPTGSDLGREWIEVTSRAADLLDLSSLHVADTTTDVAAPAGTLAPGALLVLGQSADPTKNGGAPVAAAYGTRLILNNEGEQVSICLGPCATGVVLDEFSWGAVGSAYDGHALIIDPATKAVCPAVDPFGTAGDFGTPGRPNSPCAAPDAAADSQPHLGEPVDAGGG